MKYRNISLNNSSEVSYELVKYEEKYNKYLNDLKTLDDTLVSSVINCPKIYSEESPEQSYMIIRDNYELIGAINIGMTFDEQDLFVKLQLIENYFGNKEEITDFLEILVESLKTFFFDKKNIEIYLLNNIDLCQVNPYKYQIREYDEKLKTFICTNENNKIFTFLSIEMKNAEKILTNEGQYWNQDIYGSEDLHNHYDDEFWYQIEKGIVTFPEAFYKVKKVVWKNITSNKAVRNITFNRDGKINFIKESKKAGINYEFSYDILNNNFDLDAKNSYGNNLTIVKQDDFTKIKTANLNIFYTKENKRKRIYYVSPIKDKTSVAIELWTNYNEKIESCNIDFRTHKSNGKINGLFALRINHKGNNALLFSLDFITRDGLKYSLTKYIDYSMINQEITIDFITEIVKNVLPMINSKKEIFEKNYETIMIDVMNARLEIINFLKQIKGEIPLFHLQTNLGKFIAENDQSIIDENPIRLYRNKKNNKWNL